MPEARHVWALVLAGGDGKRLRALTTRPCGTSVPKQYCSLHGGHSLLEDAIARAQRVVAPSGFAPSSPSSIASGGPSLTLLLEALEHGNLIVQPRNLGTGIGILYSLLHILAKDPQAQVAAVPADHYVRDEDNIESLAAAGRRWNASTATPTVRCLLGLQPTSRIPTSATCCPAIPIRCGGIRWRASSRSRATRSRARSSTRAVCANTFIMVASARTLLDLFMPRSPPLVMEMQVGLAKGQTGLADRHLAGIPESHDRLPELDFLARSAGCRRH